MKRDGKKTESSTKCLITIVPKTFLLLVSMAGISILAIHQRSHVTEFYTVFFNGPAAYSPNLNVLGVQSGLGLAKALRFHKNVSESAKRAGNVTQWPTTVGVTSLGTVEVSSPGVKQAESAVITTTTPKPRLLTVHPPTPHQSTACKTSFKKEYDNGKNFLCSHAIGRLGNAMFVYASAYGIAAHTKRTLVVDSQLTLVQVFEISSKLVDDYRCVVQGSKGRGSRQSCAFDEKMFDIPKGHNYCVGTYLQSYKYFDAVGDEIKRQFTFKPATRERASKVIQTVIENYQKLTSQETNSTRPVVVGIHIRRGDMVNHTYGYNVASSQYIKNATRFFKSKFKNVIFIVCSNGMDWAKQHVTGSDVIYVEGNSVEVDMCILTSCDHIVTSVGSFSWWAGYLNPGIKVYYQWPAKENTGLRTQFSKDYSDFFPSDWVGMT